MHWFLDPIKNKYTDFTGRAGRQEFWMFTLIYVGIYIVLNIVTSMIGLSVIALVFSLAVLAPSLAIGARRLHDTNMSGWWQLVGIVPILGIIALIVLMARDTVPGDNQYGPDPKGGSMGGGIPEQGGTPAPEAQDASATTPETEQAPATESQQQGYQNQ